jgi:hypothetical protein
MIENLLELIAQTALEEYRPGDFISAVNQLIPLKKQEALNAIQACFDKLAPNHETVGLFWLLRTLFDLPPGLLFPPVSLGDPDVSPPLDAHKLPRFPIVLLQDVPFLVVSNYILGGLPEQVDSHIDFFNVHGVIRSKALRHPTDLMDLQVEFERTWLSADGPGQLDRVMARVKLQIASL